MVRYSSQQEEEDTKDLLVEKYFSEKFPPFFFSNWLRRTTSKPGEVGFHGNTPEHATNERDDEVQDFLQEVLRA